MTNIKIREVTPDEIVQLQQISRQTFYETFAALNTAENMAKYLEEELSIEKLQSEFSNPASRFYFAMVDNNPIGYLKINFAEAQTELKDSRALEIERIYVSKTYQGLKVGQLLYQKAIDMAKENDAEYVWLGVWEENQKAISFYKKNGFAEFDKHIFVLGEDRQTDIMMRLDLRS